jgi:hypothetical protein
MSAKFVSNHFYYKETIFVEARGSLEVELDTIKIQVGLGFATKTLADGRIVPYVSAQDVIVDINRNDIRIKITDGSVVADIVDLFIPFFKSVVVDMINDTVSYTLETGVPFVANTAIDKTDGFLPIPPFIKKWYLDWETPASAKVTA